MKTNKIIFLISGVICMASLFSCGENVNRHELWTVKEGFDKNESGEYGDLFLDLSTYDFYQYQNTGWEYINNISNKVTKSNNPSITIDEDGYWNINDKMIPYLSYEENDVKEYLTRNDYFSQFATFSKEDNNPDKKTISIAFSTKLLKDSLISFVGDDTVYNYIIGERSDPLNLETKYEDDAWINEKQYSLNDDSYPYITISKINNSEFTQDELLLSHTMFDVCGVKEKVELSNELTSEEYLKQVVNFGSVPSPTYKTRIRMSFAIRMKKGTKITFLGNLSTYKWAVVETFDTSSKSGYLDSGWSSSWEGSKTEYTTYLEGAYIVIALCKLSNANFVNEDFKMMHSLFKVEGDKQLGEVNIPQKRGEVNATAHRGYSFRAPENTLSAFRLAKQYGFINAECDVKFTKDNVPVLLHDDTIDRTSNGTGNLKNLTFDEVRQYDFGSWKSKEFIGEKIPTFDEFMKLCKELNLHAYIEIKETITAERAQILVDIVDKYGLLGDVTWIAFGLGDLKKIVNVDDGARVGYTQTNLDASVINAADTLRTRFNEVFINVSHTSLNDSNVKLCKDSGYPLEVWTVDSIIDLKAVDPYVTGITSNWMNVAYLLEELK